MDVYQPYYAAFLSETGGGSTTDFMVWIDGKWREFDAAHPMKLDDDMRVYNFAAWVVQKHNKKQDNNVTPANFSAWVAHMKATRKWSARRCARELGCGVNQIARWSENGAPPYIALACAALTYGLPPWKPV